MDALQAIVFMLVGVFTAYLVGRVLKGMMDDSAYTQSRRALEDDRVEQMRKREAMEAQHKLNPK